MTSQQPLTQDRLDEMTFNMYVDCGRDTGETAYQLGISRSTVKARVRRHGARLTASPEYQRALADALSTQRGTGDEGKSEWDLDDYA